MDVHEFIQNQGKKEVPNPYYTKKNGQPKTMTVDDVTDDSHSNVLNMIKHEFDNHFSISAEEGKKYSKYGLNYNPKDDLENQLYKYQSGWEKLGNSISQALWSEGVLGTIGAFTNLYDAILSDVFKVKDEYFQSEASKYLQSVQDKFNEEHAIYTDPNKPVGNGAMGDLGWWMSNLPSIMSSLTLMVPGMGAGKLAQLTAKGLSKAARTGAKALKAQKILKEGKFASAAHKTEDFLLKPSTGRAIEGLAYVGANGTTMRVLENYQEAQQVYKDMYDKALNSFHDMSDEDYNDVVERNKNVLLEHGLTEQDFSNKNKVAKAISAASADLTFKDDMWNILFDLFQVYTHTKPIKLRNTPPTSSVIKAHQQSTRFFTADPKDYAKLSKNLSKKDKFKDWTYRHYRSGLQRASELTEGIEEAVNYISQQEGMTYGNQLLTGEDSGRFRNRLNEYMRSPQLYEAAFWGVLGGVLFSGGSEVLSKTYDATKGTIKDKINHTKENQGETTSWLEKYRTAGTKQQIADINSRIIKRNTLEERRRKIEEGFNPYDKNEKGEYIAIEDDIQKQTLLERANKEYLTDLVLDAADNGNYKLLKEFLLNDDIKEDLKKFGIIDDTANNSTIVEKLDKIYQDYQSEMVKIDNLSASLPNDVPFEYLQIIGRNNVILNNALSDINNIIENYEEQGRDLKEKIFKNTEDENTDFKSLVELLTYSTFLKNINEERKKIESNKEISNVDKVHQLRKLENLKSLLNNELAKSINSEKIEEMDEAISKVVWANFNALNEDSEEYTSFIDALSKKDLKSISKLVGIDLNKLNPLKSEQDNILANDEKILRIFGENEDGTFYKLQDKLTKYLGSTIDRKGKVTKKSKLEETAPDLINAYGNIASYNYTKLDLLSEIIIDGESLRTKVQELDNDFKKARIEAIKNAEDKLINLSKTHGSKKILDYINGNLDDVDNLSNAEKAELDDALKILDLTAKHNRFLKDQVLMYVAMGASLRNIQEKKNESLIEEEPEEDEEKEQIKEGEGETGQDDGITYKTPDEVEWETPTDSACEIEVDQNTKITLTTFNPSNPHSFSYKIKKSVNIGTNENLVIVDLYLIESNDPVEKAIQNKIFKDTELTKNAEEQNENPIKHYEGLVLAKDEHGNITIIEKGNIEFEESKKDDANNEVKKDENSAPEPVSPIVEENNDDLGSIAESLAESDVVTELNSDFVTAIESIINPILENPREITDDEKRQIEEYIDLYSNSNRLTEEEKQKVRTKLYDTYNGQLRYIDALLEIQKQEEKQKQDPTSQLDNGILKRVFADITEHIGKTIATNPINPRAKRALTNLLNTYERIARFNGYNFQKNSEGKIVINALNLFNTLINDLTEGKNNIDAIYTALKNNIDSDKYIISDLPADIDILKKRLTDNKSTLEDIFGTIRVGIDHTFENKPTKAYNELFDKLNINDELDIEITQDRNLKIIVVKANDKIIGKIGAPEFISDGLRSNVKIWQQGLYLNLMYDHTTKRYSSNLDNIFNNLFNGNNQKILDALNNIAYKTYSDAADKEYLYDLVYKALTHWDSPNNSYLITGNLLDEINQNGEEKDYRDQVVNYLASIIKYSAPHIDIFNENKPTSAQHLNNINLYYEILFRTYEKTNEFLVKENENPGSVKVRVSYITEGEIIHPIEKGKQNGNSREAFNPLSKGLSERTKNVFTIGYSETNGLILFSNLSRTKTNEKHASLAAESGRIFLRLPGRGMTSYMCSCTSMRTSDKDCSDKLKTIQNAITNLLDDSIDKLYNNELSNNQFIKLLSKIIKLKKDKNSTPFFYGYDFQYRITQDNSLQLKIYNNDKTIELNSNNKELFKKELLNILDDLTYSIPKGLFNNNSALNGFITVNTDRKIVLNIPNPKDSSKSINLEYDSIEDFVLDTDILRVNLAVENGSNFRHKGEDQRANRTLHVDFTESSTPVEKVHESNSNQQPNQQPDKNTNSNTNNSVGVQTKIDFGEDNTISLSSLAKEKDGKRIIDINGIKQIVRRALPRIDVKTLNNLINLGILPKNVTFVKFIKPNIKDSKNDAYAATVYDAQGNPIEVQIGEKVDKLFSDNNSSEAKKRLVVRKLIHEQIHIHIANRADKIEILDALKEIVKEYIDYCNNHSGLTINGVIEKYKDNLDLQAEEFLCESLTNEDLVEQLMNIESDYDIKTNKTKKTFWDRVLDFVFKLLNIDKTYKDVLGKDKKTLLGKELSILRNGFESKSNESIETQLENEVKEEENKKEEDNNQNENNDELELDDFDLGNDGTSIDAKFADIEENSVDAILNSIDDSVKPKVEEAINNGEISIYCKTI